MTLTVNLHNCTAWATATSYSVGDRRSNDTAPVKAYQCTTAGISATGPTGTGASISDGTAVWKYLSAVDYTTVTAAIAGVGTLTQPTVLQLWNDAEWQNTAATFSGNSTTSTNTLTLTAAPGESFVDNANALTNPLRYNQANGVGIRINSGYQNLLAISETYVILSRLQVSAYASNSTGVSCGNTGTGIVVDQCIFDDCTPGFTGGGSQSFSFEMGFNGGGGGLIKNTAIIVNACTNGVFFFWPPTMANVTIVRTANNAASGAAFSSNYGSAALKNAAAFGFTSVQTGGSTLTATTCMTDIASPPSGWTGSKTFANQFQNTGSTVASRDFRLKSGADLIDAGTTDTTNIPTATDIVGTSRPQGSAWDIGAWELVVAAATFIGGANVRTTQEQPGHPGSSLTAAVRFLPPTFAGAAPVIVRQEQPSHPAPAVAKAIVGANTRPAPVTIETTQEQPGHPLPAVTAAIAGLNARPNAARVATVQEQPAHPPSSVMASLTTSAPIIQPLARPIVTTQEQPGHPAPVVAKAIVGANTRQAPARIATTQEQPYQAPSFVTPSLYSAALPPRPIAAVIRTVQEQPAHPVPSIKVALTTSAPIIAPAPARIVTTQEQPSHPAPWFSQSVQSAPPSAALARAFFSTQEQPWQAPSSVTASLITSAPIIAPVPARIATTQEQPGHPLPTTAAAITGTNTRPSPAKIVTTQEQPAHPAPSVSKAIAGPNTRPVAAQIATVQEQPAQPGPSVTPAIVGANSRPAPAQIATTQQQPDHPGPVFIQPMQVAPIIAPPLARPIVTTQQQPDHPTPQVFPYIQGIPLILGQRVPPLVSTTQEQPWHPTSLLRQAVIGTFPSVSRTYSVPVDIRALAIPVDIRALPIPIDARSTSIPVY